VFLQPQPAAAWWIDQLEYGTGEGLGGAVTGKPLWPCIAPPGWPSGLPMPVSLAGACSPLHAQPSPPTSAQPQTKILQHEALQAHRGDSSRWLVMNFLKNQACQVRVF